MNLRFVRLDIISFRSNRICLSWNALCRKYSCHVQPSEGSVNFKADLGKYSSSEYWGTRIKYVYLKDRISNTNTIINQNFLFDRYIPF